MQELGPSAGTGPLFPDPTPQVLELPGEQVELLQQVRADRESGATGWENAPRPSSASSATANRPRSIASRARRNVAFAYRDVPGGIRPQIVSAASTSPSASAQAPRQ